MVLKSWCGSCHSSPRGCGELGFLHILLSLQSWRGGAFLSAGEPPSPAPGSGRWALERRQLCVAADGAGAGARRLRDTQVIALPGSWAARSGSPSPVPRPPRMWLPQRDVEGFSTCCLRMGVFGSCLTGAFGVALGKGTFWFIKAGLCLQAFLGVASTGAPVHLPEGWRGVGGWGREASEPLAEGPLLTPCSAKRAPIPARGHNLHGRRRLLSSRAASGRAPAPPEGSRRASHGPVQTREGLGVDPMGSRPRRHHVEIRKRLTAKSPIVPSHCPVLRLF